MASEIPVYESVPTERVGFDIIRVGDSLYTFDSADGAYLLSGPAPALPSPTPSLASLMLGSHGSVGVGAMPTYKEIPIEREDMATPSMGIPDPLAPMVIPHSAYPSGFGLMSPLGGEPSRIDWSTVPDLSLGGGAGSKPGDIAVGSGGELMVATPGAWESVGSLFGTPFWTPHEEYGAAGFGALTPPDTLPDYTPITGPRDFTGAGFGYSVPTPEPDYTAYVEGYPDLTSAYTTYKAGGGPKYPTSADYGKWHWEKYGEPEGREMVMTEPSMPPHWGAFLTAPPSLSPTEIPPEPTGPIVLPPFVTAPVEEPPVTIPAIEPSLEVLETIATGTTPVTSPIETPLPTAPSVEPAAGTTLPISPTLPAGPSAPPVVAPYVAPSEPPASGGISSSPLESAMRVLSPSFEGGGGILCDPITGKCPNYG